MEVLLHTHIDHLRSDEDREIKHHGTAVKPDQEDDEIANGITKVLPIEQNLDLISRNEKTQVFALKNHYEKIQKDMQMKMKEKRLNFCLKFAKVYNPLAVLCFVAIYWVLGLKKAEYF